jgi:glutathione synthase/RimK-type ligase-like ATP-grasp enzyme
MPPIGILAGRDRAFTDALLARLNTGDAETATYVTVGGVQMAAEPGHRVILDRIAHAVPFYQSYLKHAAVMGTHVVNDPLWQVAEDKFLGVAVAAGLGLRAPRTVLVPNREHVPGVVPESLRNRAEPLDWPGAMAWIGFPLIMRPNWGAGSRTAFLVHTPEELMARWEASGTGQFILQEWLSGAHYVHCLVVGDRALPIIRPLRQAPSGSDAGADDWELAARVADTATRLSQALGYHMNAVEFAVRDGDVMVTDWLNHCPPVDPAGLTVAEFDWAVGRTAELLTRLAETPKAPTYRWDGLLTEHG